MASCGSKDSSRRNEGEKAYPGVSLIPILVLYTLVSLCLVGKRIPVPSKRANVAAN